MSKKRRKLSRRKVLRFLVLILFLVLCIFFGNKIFLNTDKPLDNKKEEEKILDKKISLIMAGDNLIHSSIYKEAYDGNNYDFKSIYKLIKPIVNKYDLAYYNQETILGGSEIGASGYPAFNSPYEVGDAAIDTGFNMVSTATNHTLDRGENAILNSVDYWKKQDKVLSVGSYSSTSDRNNVDIREVNGISYTLLNYTYGTNGIKVPMGKEYLVNIWPCSYNSPDNDTGYQEYKKTVLEDINRVREKTDLLIVAMHWGIEYEFTPNGYQKDMAKFLSDNGVDIIIGTHPHVIQPIEYIGDTLVIYSLGNFVSAHEVINTANRVGLLTSIDIVKDKDGNIKLSNLNNELIYMYYTKDYKDFKVVPWRDMNSDYLSNYEEVYNKYKDIVTSLDSNIPVMK